MSNVAEARIEPGIVPATERDVDVAVVAGQALAQVARARSAALICADAGDVQVLDEEMRGDQHAGRRTRAILHARRHRSPRSSRHRNGRPAPRAGSRPRPAPRAARQRLVVHVGHRPRQRRRSECAVAEAGVGEHAAAGGRGQRVREHRATARRSPGLRAAAPASAPRPDPAPTSRFPASAADHRMRPRRASHRPAAGSAGSCRSRSSAGRPRTRSSAGISTRRSAPSHASSAAPFTRLGVLPRAASCRTTNAFGLVRPSRSCAPTTAASSTAGWEISASSTSNGETQTPLTFSISSRAAAEAEIAVGVAGVGVAGVGPLAAERAAGLVALVPVALGGDWRRAPPVRRPRHAARGRSCSSTISAS